MKKFIPVAIVIVLIFLVVAIGFGGQLLDRYTYSNERADLSEYYNISDTNNLPIVLQDTITEDTVKLIDGAYYMEEGMADTYFSVEFYKDEATDTLYYTTATDIIKTVIGSTEYTEGDVATTLDYKAAVEVDGQIYICLDYLRKYANFSYEVYSDPGRIQIYTQWEERTIADIKKDTTVRYQGGIKSPILEDIKAGATVVVLEQMDNWTKVKTDTAIIGYVENKMLTNIRKETPEAVNDVNLPVFENTTKDYTICMGWHQIGGMAGNADIYNVLTNVKGLNTISPTWFSLSDNQGNFTSFADHDYVDYAHSLGIEVWALIDNFNENVDLNSLLSIQESRTALINNLISTALDYNLDGINIDFENVPEEASDSFIQFIRELSIPCRENDIVLSVDNYVPREYTNYYNRKEQGIYADYVIIMGYDEHWSGSTEAGSVSSIDYTEEGIASTLKEVPANKVINGVPFYTRIWTTEGSNVSSEAVGMAIAESWVKDYTSGAVWDEKTCQNYAEYESGGKYYQVWLEDSQSMETKLNVMSKYKIAGVAAWKLGFETPDVWDVIDAYVTASK